MRKTLESIILPLFGRWNRCQHKSSQTTIFFCICRWLRRQRFAKKWRQQRSQKLGNNWLILTHSFDVSMSHSHSFGTTTKSLAVLGHNSSHQLCRIMKCKYLLMVDTSLHIVEILRLGCRAMRVSACVFHRQSFSLIIVVALKSGCTSCERERASNERCFEYTNWEKGPNQ